MYSGAKEEDKYKSHFAEKVVDTYCKRFSQCALV